jgi:hypothetical protein
MHINRRTFLSGAGGMVVASIVGVRVASAHDISAAERPWSTALEAQSADPRMRALAYAVLAPSVFNLQPWLVELPSDDMMLLRCDLALRLPEADAGDRMTVITLGNFLELLRMAAAQDGYHLAVEPFPQGEPQPHLDVRPIASIKFIRGGATPDPLFAQVPDRRTCKRPFEPRTVTADVLKRVCSAGLSTTSARWTNNSRLVERIRTLAAQAYEIEKQTARINFEQVRFTRIGSDEIEACPDGIDLQGPDIETALSAHAVSRTSLADPQSPASRKQIENYRELCNTATAYIWLSTGGNTRRDQLNAGRDWLRLHLKATELGLSFEPQSPALNTYPEETRSFESMHKLLGATSGQRVQMLSRVGYATQMPPSARWPAETKVLMT